jgi:hypothetical protein
MALDAIWHNDALGMAGGGTHWHTANKELVGRPLTSASALGNRSFDLHCPIIYRVWLVLQQTPAVRQGFAGDVASTGVYPGMHESA